MLKKVPIREREFNIPKGTFRILNHEFNRKGWGEFCKQPPTTILPVVCELYANSYERQGSVARVRGKAVAFDISTLNCFYGLEDIEYDEYSAYVSNHVDLKEIVNTICKPGTQWKMSNREATSVKTSTLTNEAKIWHYVVGARFMPSSHLSDVTRDRAILIYCIISEKTINVGSVMYASILHSIKGVAVNLYFPSLITALCGKAGVIWGPSEEAIQLVHAIDTRMMLIVKAGMETLIQQTCLQLDNSRSYSLSEPP